MRLVGVQHRQPFRRQLLHQLAFGSGQLFPAGEELHVDAADGGHDPHPGPSQRRQLPDLAGSLHGHLEYQGAVVGLKGEDGEGITTTVLPIAIAGATSEMKPSKGYSSGQAMPMTPIGSFIARLTPRKGGRWTLPSYLSAQAA